MIINNIFRLKNSETFEDTNITYENRVAKYTITETTETSSATFTVKAKNRVGTAETTCELKVQEPPKITFDESLASQNLPVGNQWKIEIQTSGFPKPEVSWSKNSEKIVDKRVSVHTEERTSTISISSLVREDTATYTAKAANQAGSASVDLHLRVIGELRSLTSDTLTVSMWTVLMLIYCVFNTWAFTWLFWTI